MELPVSLATLLAFIPAALALNLTPGPDMMFCLSQGLRGGPRAAIAADLGVALGCFVHVCLAGLGLGALLALYPGAFLTIQIFGVIYLLVLAWRTLRETPEDATGVPRAMHPFRDALLINLTNVKVILFVLAFLPQFVDQSRPILPQFLLLGVIICIGGLIVNGAVGLSAGKLGQAMTGRPVIGRVIRYVSATIFGALALRLALLSRS